MATGGVLVAGSLVAGFALVGGLTYYARKLFELEAQQGPYRIARQVVKEGVAVAEGRVRLVVYKRKDCPLCSLYESSIRPAIEEEFGEVVTIEERDAGNEKTATPLIIISGSMWMSVVGLSSEDAYSKLRMAIEAALNPAFGTLKELGGVYVLELLSGMN